MNAAAEVREQLAEARRRGVPFEDAWASALAPVRDATRTRYSTTARREARAWVAALRDTREAWEAAYAGGESPAAESLALLEAA